MAVICESGPSEGNGPRTKSHDPSSRTSSCQRQQQVGERRQRAPEGTFARCCNGARQSETQRGSARAGQKKTQWPGMGSWPGQPKLADRVRVPRDGPRWPGGRTWTLLAQRGEKDQGANDVPSGHGTDGEWPTRQGGRGPQWWIGRRVQRACWAASASRSVHVQPGEER